MAIVRDLSTNRPNNAPIVDPHIASEGAEFVAGTDSLGNPLPPGFETENSVTTFTPDADTATSKTEVKTIAGYGTYTRVTTFAPSVSGLVTKTVGDWVKS